MLQYNTRIKDSIKNIKKYISKYVKNTYYNLYLSQPSEVGNVFFRLTIHTLCDKIFRALRDIVMTMFSIHSVLHTYSLSAM